MYKAKLNVKIENVHQITQMFDFIVFLCAF